MVLTEGCDAVDQSCTPSHLPPHAPSLCPHLAPGFLQPPLVLRPATRYNTSAQNSMATSYMRCSTAEQPHAAWCAFPHLGKAVPVPGTALRQAMLLPE
jgi:hypothetical protein